MPGVVYDTGALIAAERGEHAMWLFHERQRTQGTTPIVPAPVLAEAWRGGRRQTLLARLLKNCTIDPLTEGRARAVGDLLATARFDDIVDASVVVVAAEQGDTVVTSNPAHIELLAQAARTKLRIVAL